MANGWQVTSNLSLDGTRKELAEQLVHSVLDLQF